MAPPSSGSTPMFHPCPGGKGVEAAIGNERRHLQVDGARAPQQAVGHEGRVDAVRHPDPALDQGIGDGERPYRQRSFQAKRFEIAIAIRGDLAVAELVMSRAGSARHRRRPNRPNRRRERCARPAAPGRRPASHGRSGSIRPRRSTRRSHPARSSPATPAAIRRSRSPVISRPNATCGRSRMERSSLCGTVVGERTSTPTGLIIGSFGRARDTPLPVPSGLPVASSGTQPAWLSAECPGHLLRRASAAVRSMRLATTAVQPV